MQPRLTNEQRSYLGLVPTLPSWEEYAVGKDLVVFQDGLIIRKILEYNPYTSGSYKEADYYIELTKNGELIPASGKGATRKFNASNLKKYQPLSFSFYFDGGGYLLAPHKHFHHILAKSCGQFAGWEGAQRWLDQFIASRPPDYLDTLRKFHFSKPLKLTYRAGDIVAFTFSNGHYGFCRLLLDVNLLRHTHWLKASHIHNLNRIGATIAIAEVYNLRKTEPVITLEEAASATRFPPLFLADKYVRNGFLPMVGHEPVQAENLSDLPQTLETSAPSAWNEYTGNHTFQWGLPSIACPFSEALRYSEALGNKRDIKPLAHIEQEGFFAWPEKYFEPRFEGENYAEGDLRHPRYCILRQQILQVLGLSATCNYDEFCRHFGYPTRQELLDWQAAQPPSIGF